MKRNDVVKRVVFLSMFVLALNVPLRAQESERMVQDNLRASVASVAGEDSPPKIINRIGIDVRPAGIIPTRMMRDGNMVWGPSGSALSTHLKYSFQFNPASVAGRTYAGAYQGVGVSFNNFAESDCLGYPLDFYLFQGARIASISPRLSFNYEWNFGLSVNWKPYDQFGNPANRIIGSKVNAYINGSFYLNYMVSPRMSLNAGGTITHFSNGNTKFPNGGLNTVGAMLGMVYNFSGKADLSSKQMSRPIPHFPRHVSYDLVLFGSWRRRGLEINDDTLLLPDAYTVLGFSFSPMYNFGHNFRAGVALDGFYDSSANLTMGECIAEMGGSCTREMLSPSFDRQIALGVSGRVEFVMPYFTIGLGLGTNVLHKGGDMKSVYQILSLKVEVVRNSFIHIGYTLHNFHDPNFLMLGLGVRFNNKAPDPYR